MWGVFWSSFLILQPGSSNPRLYQAETSPHLFSRPVSNDPQERTNPPPSSQECRSLPSVEITPCTSQSLWLPPCPSAGGQKSSRDLSLARGGRVVNAPPQQESFHAWLVAAGRALSPDWSLIEDRATPWSDNFTCQNLLCVPDPAKSGGHGWDPPKARSRGCSTMQREQWHPCRTRSEPPDLPPHHNQAPFITVISTLPETTWDSF